jgi:N-acyl-phosphatidylethanolamine-hydrolysing phospholipase D
MHLTLIMLCALAFSSCLLRAPYFDEAAWRKEVNSRDASLLYAAHHNDGRFFNPWMTMEEKGFGQLLKWKLSQKKTYTEEEQEYRPKIMPDLKGRIASLPEGDFIAWIGHATFLIRLNGQYWLTDPMFSERALLPKRITPPAILPEDLKGLKGRLNVLVSHNHHDHLDKDSIKRLPPGARFYVPLGLKAYVRSLKGGSVEELDWWRAVDCGGGVTLICLPVQHWSRRIDQGTNESLWASYLLVTPKVRIYFGGDSGYFIGYKEFGRKYPGIDYAILPITAYHPRWFMHYAHMDGQETIDAFNDMGAKYLIPMQWGTFHLGDEPPGYPALDLQRRMKNGTIDPSRVILIDIGQVLPVAGRPTGGM